MPLDTLYTEKRHTMVERKNYEIVAEGMRNAVIGGTCRSAAISGIEVCGKTGTAENPMGKTIRPLSGLLLTGIPKSLSASMWGPAGSVLLTVCRSAS